MMRKCLVLLLFFSVSALSAQKRVQTGKASFYADKFEGRMTASGEIFSQSKLTAAHRTLPFGTIVKVTNLANNKSVVVIVNDRGPFVRGRIIDVSKAAAQILGFIDSGVTDVVIEVLDNKNETPITDHENGMETEPAVATKFYRLELEKTEPEGFAVQVGSFEEFINVIGLKKSLENSYRKDITIEIKKVRGVNIYSVLLGTFRNRKRAARFKKKVGERFPGSFVVNFAELDPSP